MRTPRIAMVLLSAALLTTAAACGSDDNSSDAQDETTTTVAETPEDTTTTVAEAPGTIVEVASGNPDFSTLVTAVTTAGLGETLSGAGPFTVFAPTNEAFAKIPKADLDAILADKAKLTKILTYHVLPSKVMAADLQPEQKVKTVESTEVEIKVTDGKATINDCNIVSTDVAASNGVIHVIDCVLVPAGA